MTRFSDLSDGQQDLMFTMLMAEATHTDPFEMENELKNKGIIKRPSTL